MLEICSGSVAVIDLVTCSNLILITVVTESFVKTYNEGGP